MWGLNQNAHCAKVRVSRSSDDEERVAVALEHVIALAEAMGERRAVPHLRSQLPHYLRGYPGASKLREAIHAACTIAEVRACFDAHARYRHETPPSATDEI